MKFCVNCNRNYHDFVDKCPVCSSDLFDTYDSGNSNVSVNDRDIDNMNNLNDNQNRKIYNSSQIKDSALLLFKTIKQICESDKIISDVKKYSFFKSLDDLENLSDRNKILFPNYRYIEVLKVQSDSRLITVKKPIFFDCPKPPDTIINYIDNGYNNVSSNVSIKLGYVDFIQKNPNNNKDYKIWIEERNKWVEKTNFLKEISLIYKAFYSIFSELKIGSDNKELLFGFGMFYDKNNSDIYRPLFVKRMKIDFSDAKADGFKIYIDNNADIKYETDFFGLLGDNLKIKSVSEMQEYLVENYPSDICNQEECSEFLYTFVSQLSDSFVFSGNNDSLSDVHRFIVKYEPCIFYRKKTIGLIGFLDKTLDCIENDKKEIPKHISNILINNAKINNNSNNNISNDVGIRLSKICGQNDEILFTKPANKEQLDIAFDIEVNDSVQIQGPPGTGKTHTIANLIGHFLSQGKTILVVSEKKKALTVLKNKLDVNIQPLCLPVFDDDKKETNLVVNYISSVLGTFNLFELNEKNKKLENERHFCICELNKLRNEIFALEHKRQSIFVLNGESFSLEEIAEFISNHKDLLKNIPDSVDTIDSLPLSVENIEKLYSFNKDLTLFEQKELSNNLIDYKNFITPNDFEDFIAKNYSFFNNIQSSYKEDFDNNILYFNNLPLFKNPNLEAVNELSDFINNIVKYDSWELKVINDGYFNGIHRNYWINLIKLINAYINSYENHMSYIYNYNVIGFDNINNNISKNALIKIKKEIKENGKLSFLFKLRNGDVRKVLTEVSVNGNKIDSINSCNAVFSFFDYKEKENLLKDKWDKIFANTDMCCFEKITKNKEQFLKNVAIKINKHLNWNKEKFDKCLELMKLAGFNFKTLKFFSSLNALPSDFIQEICDIIPVHINYVKYYFAKRDFNNTIDIILKSFKDFNIENSVLIKSLIDSIKAYDTNKYRDIYNEYVQVYNKYPIYNNYWNSLKILKKYSPKWAKLIEEKNLQFDNSLVSFDFVLSWKTMRLNKILNDVLKESFEEKRKKIEENNKKLLNVTSELVFNRTWYYLSDKFSENPSIRQSLQLWQTYNNLIGKGKGKKAKQYQQDANNVLKNARSAIPVWITTVDRAIDMFDPNDTFDIVIIDEASQSSLEAFPVSFLGKKIIVVGDDKQVSPTLVGVNDGIRQSILQQNLQGVIQHWDLFNGQTSFYNLIGLVCRPRMLKEHFRCVPEIIQYSNSQFYNNQIIPLRALNDSLLKPAMVPIRIDGIRHNSKKVNKIEALYVIALLKACMEIPEYKDKTFGIISLLGKEQSNYINSLLPEYIDSMKMIEERQIICGDSASFQGDERDVIIITMVNDNNTIKNISFGANNGIYDKRYNVALSRAKDQVFIVHSFDYRNGILSNNSIQFKLMDYVYNCNNYINALVQNNIKAQSPFEKEVADYLIMKGYKIEQQYQAGSYFIDIVVFSDNLSMPIAVECDGERWHYTDEQIENDLKRQFILERIGWKFIRIRGGNYFKDKEITMKEVCKKLEELGVYPYVKQIDNVNNTTALLDKVKINMNLQYNNIISKKDNNININSFDNGLKNDDNIEEDDDDNLDNNNISNENTNKNINDIKFKEKEDVQNKKDSFYKYKSNIISSNTYSNPRGFINQDDFYDYSSDLDSYNDNNDDFFDLNDIITIGGTKLC